MKAFALKTFAIISLLLLVIIGGTVGFAIYWFNTNTQPVSNDKTKKTITIEKGATVAQVAEELQQQGIIRNAFAYRLWIKISGGELTIHSGDHQFSPSMTLDEVSNSFNAVSEDVRILFKEGLRQEQYAEVIKNKVGPTFDAALFTKLAAPKEGMLFPDTYDFQKNVTPEQIVKRLNDQFEANYKNLNGPTDPAKKKEVVIIASLLEREGINDEDRAIISGIIQNRLRIGMKLDIDATLQYLADSTNKPTVWWADPIVTYKDSSSPYNTYKVSGLPPTPICNPGLSSLSAALTPQKNNYLYYIHSNGKGYYAKTFEEHDANVSKYLN
jgi:UPF0755 protein